MKYLIMTSRKLTFREDVFDAHFKFLNGLREQGKPGLSGGFTDKTGGAYIIEAETLQEAKSIAYSDSIYTSNSSDVTVYEWNANI